MGVTSSFALLEVDIWSRKMLFAPQQRRKLLVVVFELGPDFSNSNVNSHLRFHIPFETLTHHGHGFITLCSAQVAKVLRTSAVSKLCWPLPLWTKPPREHLHCYDPTIPSPAVKLPPRHSSLRGGLRSVICHGHFPAQLCFPYMLFVLNFPAGRADNFQGEPENHRYHP